MFVVDQREMFENSIWTRVPAFSEQRAVIKTQVRQKLFWRGFGGGGEFVIAKGGQWLARGGLVSCAHLKKQR